MEINSKMEKRKMNLERVWQIEILRRIAQEKKIMQNYFQLMKQKTNWSNYK